LNDEREGKHQRERKYAREREKGQPNTDSGKQKADQQFQEKLAPAGGREGKDHLRQTGDQQHPADHQLYDDGRGQRVDERDDTDQRHHDPEDHERRSVLVNGDLHAVG
jgi:hypothetical protein